MINIAHFGSYNVNVGDNIALLNIRKGIENLSKKHNLKMFDIAAPIRASITGKTFSPSIFLVLEKLGKKVSIERLKKNFD